MTCAVRPRVLVRPAKTELVDDTFAHAEQITHGTAELTIGAVTEEDNAFFDSSASVLHVPAGKSVHANVSTSGEETRSHSQSPSSGISSQTIMTINIISSCSNDGKPKSAENIGPAQPPAQPSDARQEHTSPGEPTSRSANFANGGKFDSVQAENGNRLDTTKKYARQPANRQDGYWEQQRRYQANNQSKPQFWGKRSEQQHQRTKANEHGKQNAPNGADEIATANRNPFRRRAAKTNTAPHAAGADK